MKSSAMLKWDILPLFIASLCGVAGCGNSGEKYDHAVSHQLFQKSMRLIELYTDSMKNVSDSATYRRLRDGFDDKLSKVNFQFPADTDLHLTQEENDSLMKMLDKFVKIVNEKGESLNATDSVPSDSVALVKPASPQS